MISRSEGIDLDVQAKGLRFRKLDAAKLTRSQFEDIQQLRYRHYVNQLVDKAEGDETARDISQVGHFVGQATLESMRNLNTLVGRGRRQHQRYARQMMILVTDGNDELRAGLRCEDNVRSRILQDIEKAGDTPGVTDTIKGTMEMAGKLYVPHHTLAKGRNFVVEETFYAPSLDGVQLVAAGVAAEDYRDDQPAAAYPYKEEGAFRNDLLLMGLAPDSSDTESVAAFGPGTEAAEMERWSVGRLDLVRDNIHAIPGVSSAIDQALATMR